MKPVLIVTIDTEEEGLWGGAFRRTGNTVENTREIGRFQFLCDRYGVRPTYLVDTPIAEDDRSVALFRGIQDENRCEIGAHLHPWCGPPFEEEICDRNSFMLNLPEGLQREKLQRLTDLIDDRFGQRPTSFRAGRYGLDIVGARILGDLGYEVDSSVLPFFDYSTEKGPDFANAPFRPYFVGGESLINPVAEGRLLEVPISVGFNRANFPLAKKVLATAGASPLRNLRAVGILDRLGLLRHIKFCPEQADAGRLLALCRAYQRNQAEALVLMFHSSSLVPGYSLYIKNERDLNQFYYRLERVFSYCQNSGIKSATLTEFARQYVGRQASGVEATAPLIASQ